MENNIFKIGLSHPSTGSFSPVIDDLSKFMCPLGVNRVGDCTTFAVYSKNAEKILLEIYIEPYGSDCVYDYWLYKNHSDNIWRIKINGIAENLFYGFRCWGPNFKFNNEWNRNNSSLGFICDVDKNGNRFNPNKVLYDPYSKELSHDRNIFPIELYRTGDLELDGVKVREIDTGKFAPKSIIITNISNKNNNNPKIKFNKVNIFEAHMVGLTKHDSSSKLSLILSDLDIFEDIADVPSQYRGTFKGASYMAKYLKAIGFTAIEFMPIQETLDKTYINNKKIDNYWGYMSLSYFAPNRSYAYDKSPGGPTREVIDMIDAFHKENIEVYIDIVFSHTGEGGNWNNDINDTAFSSFGGFDASEYYVLDKSKKIIDYGTLCENQIDYSNTVCQNMVLDSIAYWTEVIGVDGFRLDQAPCLGRKPIRYNINDTEEFHKNFSANHVLIKNINKYAAYNNIKIIAESCDPWGNEYGNFPSGWAEWNTLYRDTIREFLKGTGCALGFSSMLSGNTEYHEKKICPGRSINYITSHDGFTLMDLVSYNHPNNNNKWPFGPSNLAIHTNFSWDSSMKHDLRRQRMRNFIAVLYLSNGTPMITYGDEMGRTQNGNNNPYNLNTIATWNNYFMINTNSPTALCTGSDVKYHDVFGKADCLKTKNPIFIFTKYMIDLRNRHRVFSDFDSDSYCFKKHDGIHYPVETAKSVWLRINGKNNNEPDLLVFFNMTHSNLKFNVPEDKTWIRLVDTSTYWESCFNVWKKNDGISIVGNYFVHPLSIVILESLLP